MADDLEKKKKEMEDKVVKVVDQWNDFERATAYWVLYHQYNVRIDGARTTREKWRG
ncbi:MAG: hypothetical protein QXD59_02010 [Candidatus Caldarchaeum sp.]